MTQEELQQLQTQIQTLQGQLQTLQGKFDNLSGLYFRTNFIDKTVFQNPVYFNSKFYLKDGTSIALGASHGGILGIVGDRIGFLGASPVGRQNAITTPTAPSAAYVQAEATSAKTAIDAIRNVLINFGLTS